MRGYWKAVLLESLSVTGIEENTVQAETCRTASLCSSH